MILNLVLSLFSTVIDFILGLVGFPDVPAELVSITNTVFDYMQAGMSIFSALSRLSSAPWMSFWWSGLRPIHTSSLCGCCVKFHSSVCRDALFFLYLPLCRKASGEARRVPMPGTCEGT